MKTPGIRASTAQHTPGPWRLDDGSSPSSTHLVASNYHFVDAGCGFHVESHKDRGFSISGVLSTADARLIASAPELLDALTGVLAIAETGVMSLGALRFARAVLAKVQGSDAS